MSCTLEMIPPAAPMASQLYHSMGMVSPAMYLWGVATLAIPGRSSVEVTERLIPSGAKKWSST